MTEEVEPVDVTVLPTPEPGMIHIKDSESGEWSTKEIPRGFYSRFYGPIETAGNGVEKHPHAHTEGPHLVSYAPEWDSFYCSVHFVWLDPDCTGLGCNDDKKCVFHGRPARPGRG